MPWLIYVALAAACLTLLGLLTVMGRNIAQHDAATAANMVTDDQKK